MSEMTTVTEEKATPSVVLTKKPHELLKQAPPFLFIDRVEEVNGKKIVCIKNLAYNEPYFTGHFPGEPIVPGVLQIEMAAQASMLLTIAMSESDGAEPLIGYLVQNKDFRFYNPVQPGDSLKIVVEMKERVGNYYTTKATLTILNTGKKASKGELVFYLP
ncbi:FabA/FabZ family ACP-dehydratase [Brevibacillus dissolubilis]|uniref:FabA/FabZ family ACP-dehydratase n=1 Tax=Brevibacillus dissolubilis TaxID=1844116 RepID=UPI00210011A9|nr:FabA/FabZ family ACP-dehydratase [Brevibacillus dissolubilis]